MFRTTFNIYNLFPNVLPLQKHNAITDSHTNMQMVVMTAAESRIRRLTPYLHCQLVVEATTETMQLFFLQPKQ